MTARLRLLARIHVVGATGVSRSGGDQWYLNLLADVKLRGASVSKLLADGDAVVEGEGFTRQLLVSEAAVAELETEGVTLETERVLRATHDAHRIDYQLYSRGRSPVRGGRASKGCAGRCRCGWTVRSNEGRASAEETGRTHVADEVDTAMVAAGLAGAPVVRL